MAVVFDDQFSGVAVDGSKWTSSGATITEGSGQLTLNKTGSSPTIYTNTTFPLTSRFFVFKVDGSSNVADFLIRDLTNTATLNNINVRIDSTLLEFKSSGHPANFDWVIPRSGASNTYGVFADFGYVGIGVLIGTVWFPHLVFPFITTYEPLYNVQLLQQTSGTSIWDFVQVLSNNPLLVPGNPGGGGGPVYYTPGITGGFTDSGAVLSPAKTIA